MRKTIQEQSSMVQEMRAIRDKVSNEIMDMDFAALRAYLDSELAKGKAHLPAGKLSKNKKSQIV